MRPLLPETTSLPPGGASPLAPKARIVVVDDEPQIRELLKAALCREGYEVTTFADGREALRSIESEPIDVLITDLRMPTISGLDLIRTAKETRPELGSILITAYASTETAVQALRFGADDYLTKPFSIDALRKVVSRVLSAGRMARDEQAAVRRARNEADDLRKRSRAVEEDLRRTRVDLDLSRGALERRVRDLEFIRELTNLLAREDDLDRMLHTTARILASRFDALVARIELDLGEGVRTAEQHAHPGSMPVLKAISSALLHQACLVPDGVIRDTVLGYGRPLEAVAVVVRLSEQPVGGVTLLREAPSDTEGDGDRFVLTLVPQALGVALEGQVNRRAAERNALGVAERIIEALEGRRSLFHGHSGRVARIAGAVAKQLGLSPRLRRVIELAARLHDVGEVGIPDTILQRRGPLDESEQAVVRMHPVIGAQILAPFGEAAAFVRHHHERPDGRGYPDRLREAQIPIGAAVIGVVEAFDAMTSPRPYRHSRTRREALAEIDRLSGSQFVPAAADALLALPRELL
ncbi:MAG: response regulator [Planctomycetota bacterium]|nr:response regulator [Planctomycetota bacterium]